MVIASDMTGAELRRRRAAANIRGAALAREMGIDPNSLYRIERGELALTQATANLARLTIKALEADKERE